MTFSGLELSAIVRLALSVALSDGEVAQTEKAALAIELMKFGISGDEAAALLQTAGAIDGKDALIVVSMMSDIQKKYVAAFLAVIIAADGVVKSAEVRVWSLISSLCSLPEMTIAEGVDFWKNN